MDPAFSERAVLQQEPVLQEYVSLCVDKLRGRFSTKGQTTVNIVDWLNFTLLDIISDLSYGESFGCLEKCQYEDWMDQMAAVIKLHYLDINLRHYRTVTTLLKSLSGFLIPKDIVKQQMDYRQRSRAQLERRLSPSSAINRPDIVSQLLRSEDRKEGLTPEEVLMNSMLFIQAASETTATALTGVFNNLIQNPASLRELENEGREHALSELTLPTLKQLPYLNAVLKEALRMCNPKYVAFAYRHGITSR
jgi:cytochrome P450